MAYLSTVASSNLDFQNFFSARLTSSLTATDTDIFMDSVPSISEGVLVIDWDVSASREVIFFNSKTASKVICPSVANGRGFDGSTATTHLSGANVIMAPVADYFRYIKYIATTSTAAWKPLGYTPNTITDNGNRQYTLVFNSVDLTSFLSVGMKVKGTPTTAQPTKCTSLNGTNHYYSKTTPGGTTFTDDFAAGGWIKPSAYPSGTQAAVISRYNGTSGWSLQIENNTGRVILCGFNGGAGNLCYVGSYAGVELNRWTHIVAQLDMSAYPTTGATNSYVMINGLDMPVYMSRGGTNPTALVQAGNLEVGSYNGGTAASLFTGKLAQIFYTNAKLTQANAILIKNQGITAANCTTYNIVSAYSFNNSIADINTSTANDLTANNGVVATNADSPFGLDDSGTPGTSEWGIITSKSYSTNTTITIQAPEGSAWSTLPTSSAISAMSYSTEKTPYGFPASSFRFAVCTILKGDEQINIAAVNNWYVAVGGKLVVPVGEWKIKYNGTYKQSTSVAGARSFFVCFATSTPNSSVFNQEMTSRAYIGASVSNAITAHAKETSSGVLCTTPTTYNTYGAIDSATGVETWYINGAQGQISMTADLAYI